jgi:diguanylate cyclase (GGDEF)-like protein/PAS domain S-box-containing protein
MSRESLKAFTKAFSKLSPIGRLQAEVDLLTTCSNDVVYRLRYDTMQYDYISPSVLNLLGYSPAEIMEMNLRSLIIETRIVDEGMKKVDSYDPLEANRKRGEVAKWQADYLMRTKDGRKIWVSDISYPWFDKKGAIVGSNGSLRDITERVDAERKMILELSKQDYTDKATGLANLRSFWIRLEEEIKRVRRTKDEMSLMLVHINKLNEIRDMHDPKMAEDIVAVLAQLIRERIREIDIVARIDDEHFGVIMPETVVQGAAAAAKRLIKAIGERKLLVNPISGEAVSCTVCIGITGLESDANIDAKSLYKLADSQLYAAQHKGENQISAGETIDAN